VHDARLLQRHQLGAPILEEDADRVHRLERPADAPRTLARAADDRRHLARRLGHERRDDVALAELDGPDDERQGLQPAHPALV
jgi:hypothetical protein